MNRIYNTKTIPLLLCLMLLMACTGKEGAVGYGEEPVNMAYSQLLTMTDGDGYTLVSIKNPWDSARALHRYILVDRNENPPRTLPEGDVIRIPVSNAAVYTSVHCGLLDELGAYDCIKGVCDLRYINLPKLHDDVRKGRVRDLGETMAPNIEAIIEMSPDIIMLSPFENAGSYGKTGKLGIPIVECADYMEASPLGRAEWIKFYGRLVGQGSKADSMFAAIEKRYNEIKEQVKTEGVKPTVVTEMKIGSTWYVAGGKSTVGILLKDAGADYIYKDVEETGALPYAPESVYEKAKEADYWLIKYNQATDMTKEDLRAMWTMNETMRAFQEGRVFCCNLTLTRFYEETPFHPDVLLREYVNILKGKADSLIYYKKVK